MLAPLSPFFFHFYAVSGKNMPNIRLAFLSGVGATVIEILDPPLELRGFAEQNVQLGNRFLYHRY